MAASKKVSVVVLSVIALIFKVTQGAENVGPPVDPGVLKYLSGVLSPEECLKVYGFLVVRNSALEFHKLISLNETSRYVEYLQRAHGQQLNIQHNSPFLCLNSLEFWNVGLVGLFSKDMIDRKDFAETLLRVSLNFAHRPDLANYTHNFTKTRHDKRLEMLVKEMETHSSQLMFNKISNKALSKKSSPFSLPIILLTIFGILSLIFLVGLCTAKIMWTGQESDYSKLNKTITRNKMWKWNEKGESKVHEINTNKPDKLISKHKQKKPLLGSASLYV